MYKAQRAGNVYALKIIDTSDHKKASQRPAADEATLQASIKSPFVVHCVEWHTSGSLLFIVLEYIEGANLDEYLRARGGSLSVDDAIGPLRDVAQGIADTHASNVIHGDVKTANVIIDERNRAKITDFGFSSVDGRGREKCGTPLYAAPEVLLGQPSSKPSDVWSFGVLMFVVLTGEYPWLAHSLKELQTSRCNPFNRPPRFAALPKSAQDLIDSILVTEPSDRPTIAQILASPFFAQSKDNMDVDSDEEEAAFQAIEEHSVYPTGLESYGSSGSFFPFPSPDHNNGSNPFVRSEGPPQSWAKISESVPNSVIWPTEQLQSGPMIEGINPRALHFALDSTYANQTQNSSPCSGINPSQHLGDIT